jgi:hypothetical protein
VPAHILYINPRLTLILILGLIHEPRVNAQDIILHSYFKTFTLLKVYSLQLFLFVSWGGMLNWVPTPSISTLYLWPTPLLITQIWSPEICVHQITYATKWYITWLLVLKSNLFNNSHQKLNFYLRNLAIIQSYWAAQLISFLPLPSHDWLKDGFIWWKLKLTIINQVF